MASKIGRNELNQPLGQHHPRAKLSDAEVRQIRDWHELDLLTYRDIWERLRRAGRMVSLRTVEAIGGYERRTALPSQYSNEEAKHGE